MVYYIIAWLVGGQDIAKEKGLALGDFPDPRMMQDRRGPAQQYCNTM